MVLDPVTEEKTQSEVFVHYASKPLVCEACNSLGHTTSVCPRVKRIWVQKKKFEEEVNISAEKDEPLQTLQNKLFYPEIIW